MAASMSPPMESDCFSASIWAKNPAARIGTDRCRRWAFDLQSQKATRLTSKKLFGWDGCWIDNDNILFLSQAAGENEASIYRMSTNGKNLKRLIKGARMPSVSAP